jgi:hypothetical protein
MKWRENGRQTTLDASELVSQIDRNLTRPEIEYFAYLLSEERSCLAPLDA